MKETIRCIGVLAALCGGLCGPVAAQKIGKIGPEFGVWRPTNTRVRQLFGNTWQNLGLGLGPVRVPSEHGDWAPDFQLVIAKNMGNRLTLAPIGYSWRRALSSGSTRSYFGVTPQLVVVRTEGPGLPNAWRTTQGVSLVVGQGFSDRFYLEGGYSFLSKVKGFNFSGWNLGAGLRF